MEGTRVLMIVKINAGSERTYDAGTYLPHRLVTSSEDVVIGILGKGGGFLDVSIQSVTRGEVSYA